MTEKLEDAIQRAGGPLPLLRNWSARAHTLPIVAEHTSWQEEQHAWKVACVLMDQSHHMTDLFLEGPDALKLLSGLGTNSFKNFGPGKAKQFIVADYYGRYIGDVILFALPDGGFDLVGREIVMDWVQYHVEIGNYDVTVTRDDNTAVREPGKPPVLYRYEVQGPNAGPLIRKVLGGELPDVKFFNMAGFSIGGHHVHALRHGMAGQPGYELFGPWVEGEDVRNAIVAAGDEFGLKHVGAKAYSTANLESGWIPPTLPGIFSGEKNKGFREWVTTATLGALGGSLNHDEIEEYYLTPYDLGYGHYVVFDHDFVGREALKKIQDGGPNAKVSLVWNSDDVTAVFGSLYQLGESAKIINIPKARYALYQKDAVLKDGKLVGQSLDCGYISNEKLMISLASIDKSLSEPGTEVTVLWGENPRSQKSGIEPHKQVEIRATVAPAPFERYARGEYRDQK
ncbi:aminomethyltransferase family protein [Leifsonia sp. Root112D2]|uniref:aminomethyltransferase family protein n=1 Tax=Leifsonia sp. Root112D2 TaxID=1736426 RepID=UPI0006F9D5B9|nr:aminomethyltransferase family protein [Leifsonia sp. Root112D2]KQV08289.1 glycine cleavage system protein T [Leifsonia sp. Root112D2]